MIPFPSSSVRRLAASVAALLGFAGPVLAADLPARTTPPPAPVLQEQGWTFTMAAYLWATGLEGRMRTLPPLPIANVSIGFDQVVKNLDGGIMAAGEAQYGRALLFFDVIASKVSPEKTFFPAGFPARVKVESGMTVALAAAGYRVLDDPRFSIDAFVGLRGFSVSNTLTLQTLPAVTRLSESEQWLDGVVGARVKAKITDQLSATLMGFAGGGGSRYEWDVFGGLNYAFTPGWSAIVGYRAMKVDYRNGPFVYDALQHGPLLGFTARF